jgi:hypothetical protein
MTRLGGLADQATPVVVDLRSQGPAISRFIRELGPFSAAATPALKALGGAADVGRPALVQAKPIITDVKTLAQNGQPLAANLAALTTSLHDTGGVERALDYAFYQVTAINGFDSFGHYLRAALLVNLCATYTVRSTDPNCSANFKKPTTPTGSGTTARAAGAGGRRSPFLRRQAAILRQLLRPGRRVRLRHAHGRARPGPSSSGGSLSLPPALLPAPGPNPIIGSTPTSPPASQGQPPASQGQGPSGPSGPGPGAALPPATEAPAPGPGAGGTQRGAQSGPSPALLNYLLGSG